jgi:hypothetical protein
MSLRLFRLEYPTSMIDFQGYSSNKWALYIVFYPKKIQMVSLASLFSPRTNSFGYFH